MHRQALYTGCLHQCPAGTTAQSITNTYLHRSAILQHRCQTARLTRKRIQAKGPKHGKRASGHSYTVATNEVDRDQEKEDSRVYKRTVSGIGPD